MDFMQLSISILSIETSVDFLGSIEGIELFFITKKLFVPGWVLYDIVY